LANWQKQDRGFTGESAEGAKEEHATSNWPLAVGKTQEEKKFAKLLNSSQVSQSARFKLVRKGGWKIELRSRKAAIGSWLLAFG